MTISKEVIEWEKGKTPQQRIEELVREYVDAILANYPPRHRDELGREMLALDLQHIATQAYLAGLEAMMDEIMKYDDGLTVSMSSDHPQTLLYQLKEQIK